jgi:hypothetical protein
MVFDGWQQVGTTSIDSAPAVAETSWRVDVFGARAQSDLTVHTFQTTCEYPSCFSSWTDLGGDTNVNPAAFWIPFTSTDGPWLLVTANLGNVTFTNTSKGTSVSAQNGAYVNTYDNENDTSSNWVVHGRVSPRGIDSAVAVGYFFATPGQGRFAAHSPDGNFYFNPAAGTFYNIGHP